MALGAVATLAAELVRTGARNWSVGTFEMAQLRQALTSRIWIEQAKGVLAASQEVTLDEGFQQLRARAGSPFRCARWPIWLGRWCSRHNVKRSPP